MSFQTSDIYLTSGSATSWNSWTPNVSKFDTSSFYNWEQDNEPLYDLEERTHFLWEKAGYPVQDGFSGIPGKMFCVSADYPFPGGSDSSGIIFRDLSSVLNTLPNPLTFPVIIEVASFGNLGEINLNNLKIDGTCPGAGLEIINRNFARSVWNFTNTTSAIYNTTDVSSTDIYTTLNEASALCVSAKVTSSTNDARYNNNNLIWAIQLQAGLQTLNTDKVYVSRDVASFMSVANRLSFTDYGIAKDPSIDTLDVSTINPVTNVYESRGAIAANDFVQTMVYGNYLTGVNIKGCNGPIFIRGFAVDGGTGNGATLQHVPETGFSIHNSNIVLENCLAMRCRNEGFLFSNSNIEIRRGLVAFRNYALSSNPENRETSCLGAGVRSFDSVLNIINYREYFGVNILLNFSNNDIGLDLYNTNVIGPASGPGFPTGDFTFLQTLFNRTGLRLMNSYYGFNGRTELLNNTVGCEINNSIFDIQQITVELNSKFGIQARTSEIQLNPFGYSYTGNSDYVNLKTARGYDQFTFFNNGSHLSLKDSSLTPVYYPNMESMYGQMNFTSSLGINNIAGTQSMFPMIEISQGSICELVHAAIKTNQTESIFVDDGPIFGAAAHVRRGSKLIFRGTQNGATIITGPKFLNGQKKTALIYGDEASVVEFTGPTFLGQAGVDVLVERGSTARFSPPKAGNGSLDVSSWNLTDPQNHTIVELHATRACLVANIDSTIIMEDLGNYYDFWPTSLASACDYNLDDVYNYRECISSGSMQFYPNPQDDTSVNDLATRYNVGVVVFNSHYFLADWKSNPAATIENYSLGGMCIRAMNNSTVKVQNVHFPTGWYNTSGEYYDVSSNNCSRLRMWNIGPGSHLQAAYCTVSGLYPSLAGYYGPSAVYTSGAAVPASGAPAGTPDTGSLSVLDYYGASAGAAGTNYGPFRIFFSVDGPSKMVGYPSATPYIGPHYQVLSQGYNPSGSASGVSAFNAIYSGINALKFYYVSGMLDPSYRNRVRMDESAANMFSNAKHCALAPRSGRIPLVTIYRATTELGGEAYVNPINFGRGIKSVNVFDLRRDN